MILGLDVSSSKIGYSIIDQNKNLIECKFKKFKTKEIMVTYGSGPEGRILLNKLNEMIAKEKGIKVSELAVDPDAPATEPKAEKKANAKKTAAKK